MAAIIIDRRISGREKNSPNRQRFFDRVKQSAKPGLRRLITDATIKDLSSNSSKSIRIPATGIREPSFHINPRTGINDRVYPGNDKYLVGDKLKKPPSGEGSAAGDDGEGEDGFSFSLTKEEFMDLLFDQCELPDLVRREIAKVVETERRRAGFSADGSPSALNVVRSMRGAMSRRYGLGSGTRQRISELQAVLSTLDAVDDVEQMAAVFKELEELQAKLRSIPFLDPIDLRFNSWDTVEIPTIQAVIVCLMDVSGSMDEKKKILSKIFFLLLYLFINRSYERVEIAFVTYHSTAQEVTEDEFWHGRETGGTVTSTGLEKVRDILLDTYPIESWNAYVAHASDGDNFSYDNERTKALLENDILPLVQYYAYVQVASPDWHSSSDEDGLWSIMAPLAASSGKLSAVKVSNESEVYPVFVKLFQRKGITNAV